MLVSQPYIYKISVFAESLELADDEHMIFAEATINYKTETGGYRVEELKSAGIGGIYPDDFSEDEIIGYATEELDALKDHLAHFNVNLSDFDELADKAIKEGVEFR